VFLTTAPERKLKSSKKKKKKKKTAQFSKKKKKKKTVFEHKNVCFDFLYNVCPKRISCKED